MGLCCAAAFSLLSLAALSPTVSNAAFVGQTANAGNTVSASLAVLYLRSDGPGDRTATPVLPMSTATPTVTALPNYDTDRDLFAGLVIQKGGNGAGETDPLKYQSWSYTAPTSIVLDEPVTLDLYSSMKDFDLTKTGVVDAFLLDCTITGTGCVTIASATVTDTFWNDGISDFVLDTFSFGTPNYTVTSGRTLRVKVESNSLSDDHQWIAYDTTAYPSNLSLGSW
ncbi:MAG: hypothetical protein ACKV2O_02505 [Acidimicrobiales bacterium]